MSHQALLGLTCTIRHRADTVDAHGDVSTEVTTSGPHPCHAYQRYREEMVDGRLLGFDELVIHLMTDVAVDHGDRVDIEWPDHRVVRAEVAGPPAHRVRARTGQVHHIELRAREVT